MNTQVYKQAIYNSSTYTKNQNNTFSQKWYQMTKMKFFKYDTYHQTLLTENYQISYKIYQC